MPYPCAKYVCNNANIFRQGFSVYLYILFIYCIIDIEPNDNKEVILIMKTNKENIIKFIILLILIIAILLAIHIL